jgi:transcriptional regulator with XRE-family HTH domain
MRTIQDYLDLAFERQELGSDRQLSRKLGLSDGAVSQFRTGKTLPSSETMIKLAWLAGIDEQVALIELSFMGATGEAKNVYEKILKKIMSFAPATLLGLAILHPDAAFASDGKELAYLPLPFGSVSGIAMILHITEKEPYIVIVIYQRKQILRIFPSECVSAQMAHC